MPIGPTVQATVTAVDQASPVLQKIAHLAKQVAAELRNQNGGGALKSQLDLANSAAGRHVESVNAITRAYSAAASAAKQLAGFAAVKAAFAIEHGARAAVEGGAELQHAEIGLRVAGIPQADLEASGLDDLNRLIAQRHAMGLSPLHSAAWNRPHARLKIDLRQSRAARLAATRRRQN